MQVSVIIPALNEAAALPLLLDDLQPARRAGHQIVLVDGGSSDNTIALAAPRIDRLVETQAGRARQMNAGAACATGELLWFLHADTRIPQNALDAMLAVYRDGRRWGRFDVQLSGHDWRLRIIETMMNLRSCLTGIATGDQGLFVEQTAFAAVGGYPDIPLMEDIALTKRLRKRQRPACIRDVRLQTSSRRWETRGVWRTVLLMWRLRLAYALGAEPAELARRYQ